MLLPGRDCRFAGARYLCDRNSQPDVCKHINPAIADVVFEPHLGNCYRYGDGNTHGYTYGNFYIYPFDYTEHHVYTDRPPAANRHRDKYIYFHAVVHTDQNANTQ